MKKTILKKKKKSLRIHSHRKCKMKLTITMIIRESHYDKTTSANTTISKKKLESKWTVSFLTVEFLKLCLRLTF